jgi:NAD(P)-dependent dehydrogenase (short-subunit alcohol dehydrogenase family)
MAQYGQPDKERTVDLKGVSAVVTGGASGLGGATAAMLAGAGARVAIFDLNDAAGVEHASAIGGIFVKANVADEASIVAALDTAARAQGVARVLVNCAGIVAAGRTVGKENKPHPLDVYRRAIEVNLIGTFAMITHFASRLAAAPPVGEERGVIINTASIAAFDGQIGQAAYASSKGGIVGMTLPVARDLAQFKIRIVTIAPGIFQTPMMKALPQATQDSLGAAVPHPSRLGKPEEYAQLVASIIANPMLNGEVIRLDGAIRMAPR